MTCLQKKVSLLWGRSRERSNTEKPPRAQLLHSRLLIFPCKTKDSKMNFWRTLQMDRFDREAQCNILDGDNRCNLI
jgi:hypothetical protein